MSAAALLVLATVSTSAGDWATPPRDEPLSRPTTISLTHDHSMKWRLSLGGLFGAAWYVPSYRSQVETLKAQGLAYTMTGHQPDVELVATTVPMVGPWLLLARGGAEARADAPLLAVSGGLQALGLATLSYRALRARYATPEPASEAGLELSFSPVAAGRLGLTVCLTGW